MKKYFQRGGIAVAERRVNLRFDEETFTELDVKRAREGASFQELGAGWFLEWLRGSKGAPKSDPFPDLTDKERRILRGLLAVLRDESDDPALKANRKVLELLSTLGR